MMIVSSSCCEADGTISTDNINVPLPTSAVASYASNMYIALAAVVLIGLYSSYDPSVTNLVANSLQNHVQS